MDGLAAARILVERAHDVATAGETVACIELHDDAFVRIAHEDIPRRLAVNGGEFGGVVVVASAHAVEGELVGDLVELLGGGEPFVGGLGGNAGDHDVGVADGLVQLDGCVDFVILHAVPRGVPSAADKACFLQ